jgi:hypothetical protein
MKRALVVAAWLIVVYLLCAWCASAQVRIAYSLQNHHEVCAQLGPSCRELSLWSVEVANLSPASTVISKSFVRSNLVVAGVQARDDSSAAAVVLHREKRGGWQIGGNLLEDLLLACSGTALVKANLYVAGGCAITSQVAPRAMERTAGYAPRVQESLGRILMVQHLELGPGASGSLIIFSARYADVEQTTYVLHLGEQH